MIFLNTVNNRKSNEYINSSILLEEEVPKFSEKTFFLVLFSVRDGAESAPCQKNFRVQSCETQRVPNLNSRFREKKFCQFEKRSYLCTRFRQKRGVPEGVSGESKRTLKFWKHEIACVGLPAGRGARRRRVKGWKNKQFLQ